jgi:hypothetical protein
MDWTMKTRRGFLFGVDLFAQFMALLCQREDQSARRITAQVLGEPFKERTSAKRVRTEHTGNTPELPVFSGSESTLLEAEHRRGRGSSTDGRTLASLAPELAYPILPEALAAGFD